MALQPLFIRGWKQLSAYNTISVAGLAKAENAAIYSIGGEKVVNLMSWNGSPVNVGSLSNGVYILKVNNKSFKFIKK